MTVTVELPRLVADAVGCPREVAVDASDTDEVLEALVAAHPGVATHLLDGAGRLRVNVLCAVDDAATRLEAPLPVGDGSRVRFVPSVAGG